MGETIDLNPFGGVYKYLKSLQPIPQAAQSDFGC